MQQIVVILLVVVCAAWLGYYVYRFVKPRAGGCGGSCGCGSKLETGAKKEAGQTVFFRSDDLVARLKARKG